MLVFNHIELRPLRRHVWLAICLLLSSCSTESGRTTLADPPTNPAPAEGTTTEFPTQSSTSTTSSAPRSVDDERVTPQSELAPANLCKHSDKTSREPGDKMRYGWTYTSGFPRPEHLPSPTESPRVLIVPFSTTDSQFDDLDVGFVQDGMDFADEYFREMSYGIAGIEYDITPKEAWVQLDGTLESEGIFRPTDESLPGADGVPHGDLSSKTVEIIRRAATKVDVSAYDIVAVVSHFDPVYYAGHVYGPPEGVNTDSGTIFSTFYKGGRNINNPAAWVHEFGHAWLGFEDLYDLRDFNIIYLGRWDMMEWAGGAAEFNSWMRWRSGWVTDEQVRCLLFTSKSTHYVEAVNVSAARTKAVIIPLDQYRVLVVESHRININNAVLNDPIVYEIDTNKWSGQGPFRLKAVLSEIGRAVEIDGYRFSRLDSDSLGDLISIETITP